MWKNGNQDGWGMKRWGDSSWYEGEWSDGQKHGKGTYSWIGTRSHCAFVDATGLTRFAWVLLMVRLDGRRYIGQWKLGKKHGVGNYLWVLLH
jgi:hypothetical protein